MLRPRTLDLVTLSPSQVSCRPGCSPWAPVLSPAAWVLRRGLLYARPRPTARIAAPSWAGRRAPPQIDWSRLCPDCLCILLVSLRLHERRGGGGPPRWPQRALHLQDGLQRVHVQNARAEQRKSQRPNWAPGLTPKSSFCSPGTGLAMGSRGPEQSEAVRPRSKGCRRLRTPAAARRPPNSGPLRAPSPVRPPRPHAREAGPGRGEPCGLRKH